MSALQQLWESTEALHERFFPDKPPSFEARYRVFCEEIAEFTLALTDTGDDEIPDVAGEAADILVTLFGLLQGYGLPYNELMDAIAVVKYKNDCKTLETHEVDKNGKITRKGDKNSEAR